MFRYWIKLWSCRDALSARSVCNVQRAAFNAISFDNAHPAHVGGEVVDVVGVLYGPVAVVLLPQVEGPVVRQRKHLKPLVWRLGVDGAHLIEALPQQSATRELPKTESVRSDSFYGVVDYPDR